MPKPITLLINCLSPSDKCVGEYVMINDKRIKDCTEAELRALSQSLAYIADQLGTY